jgi:peptidoglycan/xylan/chitin deacetylase (PgdA/CDA1 family)
VVRHVLAPAHLGAADALGLARTLPGSPGVALTFDDGPHPEGTPAVLDVLARAGARATFFVVGEQVRARPALVAEIASAGHVVALHGDRHRLQTRLTGAELQDDLARGLAAIHDASGIRPALHRPPFGIYSPAGLRTTRAAGLSPLLWSRAGKDWRRFTTPRRIAARSLHAVLPGDVILLHDADFYSSQNSHRRTAAALEFIVAELRRRRLDTVLAV